jgi:hypothetical protein
MKKNSFVFVSYVCFLVACFGNGKLIAETLPSDDESAQIESFVFVAISVLNEYKKVTANYLSDNDSVSSIPRNARSLQERHLEWMRTFEKQAKEFVPEFNEISSLETFRTAFSKVEAFEAKIPKEASLWRTELEFADDLRSVQFSLLAVNQRIRDLLASKSIVAAIQHVGPEAARIKSELSNASRSLVGYVDELNMTRKIILADQAKRYYLKTSVPATWKRNIEKALIKSNQVEAESIIQSVKIALQGPEFYAKINNRHSYLQNLYSSYLNSYFSPLLALKTALKLNTVLLKSTITVSQTELETTLRESLNTQLERDRDLSISLIKGATEASTRNMDYPKQREKYVAQYLTQVTTKECLSLGSEIINDGPQMSLSSERKYVSFMKNCKGKR